MKKLVTTWLVSMIACLLFMSSNRGLSVAFLVLTILITVRIFALIRSEAKDVIVVSSDPSEQESGTINDYTSYLKAHPHPHVHASPTEFLRQ